MAILALLTPALNAQDIGVTVHVSTNPPGVKFSVDGVPYTTGFSAVWAPGSKHTLSTTDTVPSGTSRTKWVFKQWTTPAGQLPPGSTLVVTADAANSTFIGVYDTAFSLQVAWFGCTDSTNCASSGIIYADNAPHNSDFETYYTAGASVELVAVPNSGFVFAGWNGPLPNQNIQGFINTVSMNQPIVATPIFQVARKVNLVTNPPELDLLADRSKIGTPAALEWGWNSVHTVGAIVPVQDKTGNWWAFSSWSDGGASTHAYTVAPKQQPDTLTANFVPVNVTQVSSNPPGLPIKVDGRTNWPSYNFPWGAGEKHKIEALTQQTDDQGRVWSFASWSNGGTAAQDFVVPEFQPGVGVRVVATYKLVGHLTVNSTLAGIAAKVDGKDCMSPCDILAPVGSVVKLSAPGSLPLSDGVRADFNGWPGTGSQASDTNITLTGDPQKTTMDFHVMNKLSTAATFPEGANWSIQPTSSDGFYDAQATVILNIKAQPGFKFLGWNGDLSGTVPNGAVSMNTPRAVQANLGKVPYIAPAGIGNGAGSTPVSGVAPGSLVSIFGASLAPAMALGPDSPMVQTLAGTTVRIGDRFLPLFFVSPAQINVQLPDDLGLGEQRLTVGSTGLPDVQAVFQAVRNAPGLFQQAINGQSFAIVSHEDASPVTLDSPARKGELLMIYGTGFGPTNRPRLAGFALPGDAPYQIVDTVSVQVGDSVIAPENAVAVAGRIGIDAIQFRLSDDAPVGMNAAIHINVNGQDSNTVLLPVQ